jgi:hypothetical protein
LDAFFDYWGWKHDYNNAVLSVRTGGLLTKRSKDWWVCGFAAGRQQTKVGIAGLRFAMRAVLLSSVLLQ